MRRAGRISAGLLLFRRRTTGIEVLLVHRRRDDDWALPKGGARSAESDEQCAIREVQEETGLRCTLDWELAGASYLDGKGVRRTVRYWAARPLSLAAPLPWPPATVRWPTRPAPARSPSPASIPRARTR